MKTVLLCTLALAASVDARLLLTGNEHAAASTDKSASAANGAQQAIQVIDYADEVDKAKAWPYHSWTNVHGVQTASEADVQVQKVEASLSPAQQEQLKLKLKQKHALEGQ